MADSPTFFNLPGPYHGDNAYFKILPVPYEGTVCFERGTALGPERICAVSDQMEYIDEESHREFWRRGIQTLPPVTIGESSLDEALPEEVMARVARAADGLFSEESFPIILGGEHSITAPVVRAARKVYPNLSVLQFDAHSDLRDSFPPGGKHSHASVMRRVLEITPHLAQVGIRSFCETDLVECPEQVQRFITPVMLEENFDDSLARIIDFLTDVVYITFDMDAFDPAIAPGVGTPEPGGLTWRQVMNILRRVFAAKRVVGADIVETMPLGGNFVTTEFLAARLAAKIMNFQYLALENSKN